MPEDIGFLGMRGTGDWVTDQRPKNWREGILRLYPNGMAPLTAIMAMLPSEAVDDAEFNWWTKAFPTQKVNPTGIYTDSGLSVAYVSGGIKGATLYAKMAAASAKNFRIGHTALMRVSTDATADVVAKVTLVTVNGDSSYLRVKLLEADDNSAHSHTLANCDTIIIIGNVNEEGAAMPGSVSYDPTKVNNYTQIWRTPLSITRTARQTKLRTYDQYKESKREALEIHSVEMERSWIFGIPTEETGDGGKPERTTGGIQYFVKEYVPGNIDYFNLNAAYAGKKWIDSDGGWKWFKAMLELLFAYGSTEKLALCGNGALSAINTLAEITGHITLTPQTRAYGIKVLEWISPFGTLYFKTAPLFSQESTLTNSMLVLDTRKLRQRIIQDTKFYGEGGAKAGEGTNSGRVDATNEEYLTEAGLELHHPACFGALHGVGLDGPTG